MRRFGELDQGEIRKGTPAPVIAREIRDAYSGSSEAFYVPVGDDAREVVPSRAAQDDREFIERSLH